MKYKLKTIFVFAFVFVMFLGVVPVTTKAVDVQSQIQALMQQIATLQAQLKSLQSQQGSGQAWCYNFTKNLGIGSTGPDLDALITVLDKESISEFTVSNRPSEYNEIIAGAVSALQQKYTSEILTPNGLRYPTGYVGPSTRKKLNALYGCEIVAFSPLITISPQYTNLIHNQTYNFSGELKNGPPNSQIKLYIKNPDGTMYKNGEYVGMTNSFGEYSIKTTQKIYNYAQTGTYTVWVIAGDKESNKINFNVSSSTQPSITVISPNGGEQWKIGEIHKITWTSLNVGNFPIEIDLLSTTSGEFPKIIASGLSNNGSYNWFIDSTIPIGNYTILVSTQAMEGAIGSAAGRSGVFSILNSTAQPHASIISLDPGSPLAQNIIINQTSWLAKFKFTNPTGNNETISKITFSKIGTASDSVLALTKLYSSNSGQVLADRPTSTSSGAITFSGLSIPVPAYSSIIISTDITPTLRTQSPDVGLTVGLAINSAGDITASDNVGQFNVSGSFPVRGNLMTLVGTSTIQPIEILNVQYSPASPKINDFITTYVTVKNTSSSDYNIPFKVNVQGTTVTVNSLATGVQAIVNVPNAFSFSTPGTFTLNTAIIYPTPSDPNSGTTGDVFTNTLTFSTTQPSITVTSPNGGETLKQGQTVNIIWNHAGLLASDKINIWLDDHSGTTATGYMVITNLSGNLTSYQWTIPSTQPVSEKYRFSVQAYRNNSALASDGSDNYFSIVAPTKLTTSSLYLIDNKSTYNAGSTIKFSAKAVVSDGSAGSPDKGFNVQYHLRDSADIYGPPINGVFGNATYNSLTGYWDITATAPSDTSKTYVFQTSFYCSWSNPGYCDAENQPAQINKSFSFNTTSATQPSITVTSPSGGEQWQIGKTYQIKWSGTNIPSNGVITISIHGTSVANNHYIFSEIENSQTISWTIPNTIAIDTYKMRIACGEKGTERYCSPDGTISSNPNAEDYSDNYFTIVAPTANQKPVISSVSGPTSIVMGQTGTWTVNASDPEGDPLTYTAGWGDTSATTTSSSNTFTHSFTMGPSYQDPTEYQNGVTVRDSAGNEAKYFFYVKVYRTSTQPSITVTSPSGGEVWKVGSFYDIKWGSVGLNKINIELWDTSTNRSTIIAKDINTALGKYTWTPGASVIPGDYKITIVSYFTENTGISDSSNNSFKITAATTSYNDLLESAKNQLASISDAIANLIKSMKGQ